MQGESISGRIATVATLLFCLTLAGCGGDEPAAGGQPFDAETQSQANTPAEPIVKGLPDFTELVKTVSPAVVNISATPPKPDSNAAPGEGPGAGRPDAGPLGDWLKRFFQEHPPLGQGPSQDGGPAVPAPDEHVSLGSGFIISSDGYILTNRHVIAGAGQIVVKLNDRRQLVAKLVGADADSDIAVLKVDANDLPTVRVGQPDDIDVGSWVVAIGSPFGFETSVTAGIVSAKNRNLADNRYVSFLQTDVAINPGNSGGPLFDLAGRVIGINSQIYSETGGYQGVSFAIPIDAAMNAARQLRDHGEVVRGWLGVQIQDVDRKLAQSFDLNRPVGALVTQIMPNSPAAGSKIEVGDVILSLNDHAVGSAADLPPLVGRLAPGQKARLTILRDGDQKDIEIAIKALPAAYAGSRQGPTPGSDSDKNNAYGLSLAPLDDETRKTLDIDRQGVRITAITGGPAAEAGLAPGDIILSVGSRPVARPAEVLGALKRAGDSAALLVLRDGARRYIPLALDGSGSGS